MHEGFAIDAGWLQTIEEGNSESVFERIRLLLHLNDRSIPILLDHEGHIIAEYTRVLTTNNLGRRFVRQRLSSGPAEYCSQRPLAACHTRLQTIGFDPSDIPYVGVAQHFGRAAYLTHEGKHLDSGCVSVVLAHCNVRIVGDDDITSIT